MKIIAKVRLAKGRRASKNAASYLEGWPDSVSDPVEREALYARRLKGRRYDDPGQVVRFKSDRVVAR